MNGTDLVLQALRQWPDSYRCDADFTGVWHAYCPVCRERFPVRVTELGVETRVRCFNGCHEDRIIAALAAGPPPDPIPDVLTIGIAELSVTACRELRAARLELAAHELKDAA